LLKGVGPHKFRIARARKRVHLLEKGKGVDVWDPSLKVT